MKEYLIYTGKLSYRNIQFDFVFDKEKLKLIPPDEKKDEVDHWFVKAIDKGVYISGDPIYITEILYGTTNENLRKIIFIPSYKSIEKINSTLNINIDYYIINKYNRDKIDRIAIKGPEINHIFPTTNALNEIHFEDTGEMKISTKPFSETTSPKEEFSIENKKIYMYWGISISTSQKNGEIPLSLSSTMFVEFEETDNYKFIIEVIQVAKQFIRYICYRKNVIFSSIELASPASNGKHEVFSNVYQISDNIQVEKYPLESGRYIKYEFLKGNIGKILNDIVSKNIYLEHIPETYKSGRYIDASRFIMITSGFEWEFKKHYPDGIERARRTLEAEKKVNNTIEKLIDKNTGKQKEIWKYLKKQIKNDTLKARIIKYSNDFGEKYDMFGKRLYELNNEELNYEKMGERLGIQRNNFAHGNIDKEFKELSLLDLIYLEQIIYILQLDYYEIDDNKIKSAINDLFKCSFLL